MADAEISAGIELDFVLQCKPEQNVMMQAPPGNDACVVGGTHARPARFMGRNPSVSGLSAEAEQWQASWRRKHAAKPSHVVAVAQMKR